MHYLNSHTHDLFMSARSVPAARICIGGSLAGGFETTCDAGQPVVQKPSIQRSRLSMGDGLSIKGRALASVFTMFAALATMTPVSAMELIQCPGWGDLVPKPSPISLRTSAPKESFESRITRTIDKADASPLGVNQPMSATHSPDAKHKATLPGGSGGCKTYTVRAGDTLGKIAVRELGSSSRHKEILAANTSKVKSATALQIGTVLELPCTAVQLAAKAAAESKRTPWFKRKPVTTPETAEKPATATQPVVLEPAPKPLPRFTARKGEYLSDVIKRWGAKNGYTVIVDGPADWKLGVKFSEVGTFEDVVQQLIKGFARDGLPPSVRIHSNKVLKIGAGT